MYTTVVFDLDGTLVRTAEKYVVETLSKTLTKFGKILKMGLTVAFWFDYNRDEIIKEQFCIEPKAFWTEFAKEDNIDIRRKYVSTYNDIKYLSTLKKEGLKYVCLQMPQII